MSILAKDDGETLEAHTLECIEVAQIILDGLPSGVADERFQADLKLALTFHDTGKAAIGFQEVLRHKRKDWNHRRHEIISASLATFYGQQDEIIMAILTHHRQIPLALGDPSRARTLEVEEIPLQDFDTPEVWLRMKEEWEANQFLFSTSWARLCNAAGIRDIRGTIELPKIKLNSSWLDRGRNGQRRSISFNQRWRTSHLRGLLIASDHLASAHRKPPSPISFKNFHIIANPRAFQKRCMVTEGSILLRSPTGSGKTEAALLWAQTNQEKNARLFYVLPNIASINAMHLRLGHIFGESNVGLLHSKATATLYRLMERQDDSMSKINQSRARELSSLARTIWFPIRVSTPHQILRHSLKGKGWEIMFAEFPKACIIFDEIHTYEPRIVGLTLATLKLFSRWQSRFCFMSATMPHFLIALLERVAAFTSIEPDRTEATDNEILEKTRHKLEFKGGTVLDNLPNVLAAAHEFANLLLVCNSVASAQRLYKSIPVRDKLLLHSRFNQRDRLRIEECLRKDELPKIVVATQAIEVSLNVSFQRAFLEPAPIDALVQRMGRVNRFGLTKPAKITIFREEMSTHSVYANSDRVARSMEALESLPEAVTESDLVMACDKVYSSGYSEDELEEYNEGFNHPDLVDFEDNLVAGASEDWVEAVIERTDRNVEILPQALRTQYADLASQGLWIEANSLLVPVQVRSVTRLIKSGLVDTSSDPWTASCHYDSELGLVPEPQFENII